MDIPQKQLGRTGIDVTIVGLGGEGILRTYGHDADADALINRALDLGINYFESARAYSGSESYYGAALKERRKDIFLTSKSHARDNEGALAHLQETLNNMKTDYLDLWQVHDVREESEIEKIFSPHGALEAFVKAKEQGMVRFIGVTGHHNPLILKKCIELYDFDTVLLPVNPAEPHYMSFIDEVMPSAIKKEMGIIAMKIYFRGFASRLPDYTTMEPYYRFALSQAVSTAVIGCDNIQQLEENVQYATSFKEMPDSESQELISSITPYARDLMYYKP